MKATGSLVFFVGNAEVKGAIVLHDGGHGIIGGHKGNNAKPPRIVTTRIRDLPFHADRSREQLEQRILTEFAELVKEMRTKDMTLPLTANIHIKDALVILSSPWYVSETSIIKMKEQKPFIVTEKLLESSKENVVKAYRDAHKVDVSVLEQKMLQITLNGYQTSNPLKKQVTELDMSVFTSFARQSSLDEIRRTIETHFNVQDIKTHSHSLAAFTLLRYSWKDLNHYILADITSELTELVVIKNGTLAESASFPKGKKYLRDIISETLGVSMEVATSFLNSYEKGVLEEGLSAKISTALEIARKGWIADFSEALSQLSSGASLPKQFFLFASKDSGRTFSEFILSESYQQFSFAEGMFTVKVISALDFKDMYACEYSVIPDPSIVIGVLFEHLERTGS